MHKNEVSNKDGKRWDDYIYSVLNDHRKFMSIWIFLTYLGGVLGSRHDLELHPAPHFKFDPVSSLFKTTESISIYQPINLFMKLISVSQSVRQEFLPNDVRSNTSHVRYRFVLSFGYRMVPL